MMQPLKLSGEYYSTKAAAEALGRTEGRVRQLIRAGELGAVEISERAWLIPAKEVHRMLRERSRRTA